MEETRREPFQPQDESQFQEVILEPIQDLALPPKKTKRGSSLSRKRKKRRQQQRVIIALGVAFAVLLTVFIVMFVNDQREAAAQIAAEEAARAQQELERQEYEALANSTTFIKGITVNGIAIGGMTMDEAKTALASAEASLTAQREVPLVYDNKLYPLDLSNMPTIINTTAVLNEAYFLGKTGDCNSMKAEVADVQANGHAYILTVSYDLAALTTGVATIAAQLDIPGKDAAVTGVDKDTHTLIITDEVTGLVVDQPALVALITEALQTGLKTAIPIPLIESLPTLTAATLQGQYVLRASMTTDFSSSTSERKYNVRKGARMINGTVLEPDETFSANDTLGARTYGNGWKVAHAYVSGTVEDQAGGGVCQLSTTLYNAILKADLEVVFRRNHSMPVSYIDTGLDATINSVGNIIDFKFKNNTEGDIIVIAYTSSSKLTFEIWGLPFATTEYDQIKLASKLISSTSSGGDPVEIEVPVGTEKANGSLMVAGETYIAVTPRKGYTYQSYKKYYKDGTLVKTEKIAYSTYRAFQGEIWHCLPNESQMPDDTPEMWVTDTPEVVPTAVPTPTPTTSP